MKAPPLRISFDWPPQRKLGTLLAFPFILMGGWCGWCAWQQHHAQTLEVQAASAREAIAQSVSATIAKEQKSLAAHMGSTTIAAAIARQDLNAVGIELSSKWKGAEEVGTVGSDLSDLYEARVPGKFARLALLEATLLKEGPSSVLMRTGKAFDLALAYPLLVQNQTVGVAYGKVPMKSLADSVKGADIDGSSYLAIRQGNFSAVETGDQSLADMAASQSTPIKGSNLHVVSASADAAPGPFGLDAMSSAIAALVSLLLAGAAATAHLWVYKVKLNKRAPQEKEEEIPLSAIIAQSATLNQGRPTTTSATQAIELDADFKISLSANALLAADPMGEEGIASDDDAYMILGRILGSWFAQRGVNKIVIGGESAGAGMKVKEGMVEGLTKAGLQVSPLDQATHPFVLFAANHLQADAAITLEELHTVPTHTRLRLFIQGQPATTSDMESLNEALDGAQVPKANAGTIDHHEVETEYKRKLSEEIALARPVRIKVSGEHEELTARVLGALGAHISTEGQDFELVVGVSDRGTALTVANGSGVKIRADRLLTLMAMDLLQRNPGAIVVCDATSASTLSSEVLGMGGVVRVADEGLENLQPKVVETGAVIGGDAHGHISFPGHLHTLPDGIYAAARFLEIVANAYHADDIFES